MTTDHQRWCRAWVVRSLMDKDAYFLSGSDLDAAWWLVSQGLVTHHDGVFTYVGPVKAEAVAS